MKKIFIIVCIVVFLAILGFGGRYFFLKKLPEGVVCKNADSCETGLKCANKICSSGDAGSSCEAKEDCKTNFCITNKCTEGKKGDICQTYRDCQEGLFCKEKICVEPPSYSQYFNKIVISKMKIGIPPGPNNIPVPTVEFKTTDAIEIDFVGVKPTTVGEFYYEVVDQVSGEVVFTSSGYKQKFEGRDMGTGSDLPRVVGKGKFDLNIFYNDEIIYTTTIEVAD
ncbi:MAG: hypothetical protein WC472_02815 [Candidatus Paceibacterota bacterium]